MKEERKKKVDDTTITKKESKRQLERFCTVIMYL
jgi:hypothetical protein